MLDISCGEHSVGENVVDFHDVSGTGFAGSGDLESDGVNEKEAFRRCDRGFVRLDGDSVGESGVDFNLENTSSLYHVAVSKYECGIPAVRTYTSREEDIGLFVAGRSGDSSIKGSCDFSFIFDVDKSAV